jgi:MFS transporter
MVGLALFAVVIYLPVFLQGVLGVKATNSGLITTPLVVTLAIAAALVGLLIFRIGRYQFLSIIGALIIVAGFYLLSQMTVETTQQTVVYYMIVLGVGLGMLQPVMTLAVQNAIPLNRLGAGTGAVTYLRTLGSALGAAIVGAIVTNVSDTSLTPRLATIKNSSQLMDGLRNATHTLTNAQALQPLLTDQSLRDKVRVAAVAGANNAPSTQQAIDQAVAQAQNSPQTQQAMQAAIAKATASIPPNAPNRDQLVSQAIEQINNSINQAIASKVTTSVHQAITASVTDTYNAIIDAGKHALAAGIQEAYLFAVGVGVVIVIITLFLKDVPLRGGRVSMAEGAEAALVSEGAGQVPASGAPTGPASGANGGVNGGAPGGAKDGAPGDRPGVEPAPAFGIEGAGGA